MLTCLLAGSWFTDLRGSMRSGDVPFFFPSTATPGDTLGFRSALDLEERAGLVPLGVSLAFPADLFRSRGEGRVDSIYWAHTSPGLPSEQRPGPPQLQLGRPLSRPLPVILKG